MPCAFGMLAPFSQFETDVKYTGRNAIATEVAEQVRALAPEKRGPAYIAATLKISRMSVHRILGRETAR